MKDRKTKMDYFLNHNNRLLIFTTSLFLLCLLASCNTYKAEDLSKIKNKVVFVEEHTKGDGLSSGNFGDVMLLDLDSKKTYNLTNDDFYDLDPHFSHDGKFIYFQSNRSGSKMDRMISGVGGPYNTCILDINSGEIRKIDFDFEKDIPEYQRTGLEEMQLTRDNSHLYFDAYPPMILRSTIRGDSVTIVKDFSNDKKARFTQMRDMKLSPDDKYLAFRYEDVPLEGNDVTPRARGLAIYDLKNHGFRLIDMPHIFSVNGWTSDSRKIIYFADSKINSYDVFENKSEVFLEHPDIYINCCIMLNENKMFLLAANITTEIGQGEEKYNIGNPEVAEYDLKNKKLVWLTNDGLEKDYIDVYSESKE